MLVAGGAKAPGGGGDQRTTRPVKQIITSPLCNLLRYLASSSYIPLDTSSRTSKLLYQALQGYSVRTSWKSEFLSKMRWLETMRSLFKGGSRSAPVTPTSSPSMPSKKDLSAKQHVVSAGLTCAMTAFVWVENHIRAEQRHYAYRPSPMKDSQRYDGACESLAKDN
ncbi:neuron navigator 3 isoform X6 [Labeo rohita]|uniref:Neuron navigator 3 isoform X6 n=1 Tax=Labeo rohita TaxID=84645 RepID=A0A498LV33_LABRO|nr:neuron navigator 3 isoform X6 [Labeo rohita]